MTAFVTQTVDVICDAEHELQVSPSVLAGKAVLADVFLPSGHICKLVKPRIPP